VINGWKQPKLICLSRRPRNKVPTIQELLSDLTSGDEIRAERAVPLLIKMGEDVIPSLMKLTHSPNPDTRWWALSTLAQSPHCRTEWLLPFLTNDLAPEIRQCAALGLANHVDENSVDTLIKALDDADGMVCNLAANALIKLGKESVPALIEVVKTGKQSARIQALRALAEIRDHRAIPVMMNVMGEDSALLLHWAREGLDRLGLDMVYIKAV